MNAKEKFGTSLLLSAVLAIAAIPNADASPVCVYFISSAYGDAVGDAISSPFRYHYPASADHSCAPISDLNSVSAGSPSLSYATASANLSGGVANDGSNSTITSFGQIGVLAASHGNPQGNGLYYLLESSSNSNIEEVLNLTAPRAYSYNLTGSISPRQGAPGGNYISFSFAGGLEAYSFYAGKTGQTFHESGVIPAGGQIYIYGSLQDYAQVSAGYYNSAGEDVGGTDRYFFNLELTPLSTPAVITTLRPVSSGERYSYSFTSLSGTGDVFIPILDRSGLVDSSLPADASLITNPAAVSADWPGADNTIPSGESAFDHPAGLLKIPENGNNSLLVSFVDTHGPVKGPILADGTVIDPPVPGTGPASVPEPSTLALFLLGMAGLGLLRRTPGHI